jgi:muramoyltetrapeptide carboxypeptidase
MIPRKLSPGDEIRVITPSSSYPVRTSEVAEVAVRNLAAQNFHVTFGEHCEVRDEFNSSSIASRVADLHDAFTDPQVKGILTAIGGYNSNQLLRYLDYDLIRGHPKILCGYSDITALSTAITVKTGLVTYSGPHFSTFGMEKGLEYTREYFKKCLVEPGPFDILSSPAWSDDPWYQDQSNRTFLPNEGLRVVNEGRAEGTLLGGNLCTLNLLQGTEFMPSLAGSILLVEDDDESNVPTIDRDLQSLIHQPGFEQVKGLVIGRFQHKTGMDPDRLLKMIRSKAELAHIPVVVNADFGHTTPQFTFPIGGKGRLAAVNGQVSFTILEH